MKIQSISSYMLANSTRNILAKAQVDLIKAKEEATTGFVSDTGLALGSRTGQSISLRKEFDRLTVLTETNNLIGQRMKTSQNALGNMVKGATTASISSRSLKRSGRAGRPTMTAISRSPEPFGTGSEHHENNPARR